MAKSALTRKKVTVHGRKGTYRRSVMVRADPVPKPAAPMGLREFNKKHGAYHARTAMLMGASLGAGFTASWHQRTRAMTHVQRADVSAAYYNGVEQQRHMRKAAKYEARIHPSVYGGLLGAAGVYAWRRASAKGQEMHRDMLQLSNRHRAALVGRSLVAGGIGALAGHAAAHTVMLPKTDRKTDRQHRAQRQYRHDSAHGQVG